MRRVISILLCTVVSLASAQTVIYKKVNADGTITYSDSPFPGASEIVLEDKPLVIPGKPVSNAPSLPQSKRQQKEYSLQVVSPEDAATIRNNAGLLSIQAKLNPNLAGTYRLEINGDSLESPSGAFVLENMDRGEYQYKVTFIDTKGKVIAFTEQRTLYLHRASVLFPNR